MFQSVAVIHPDVQIRQKYIADKITQLQISKFDLYNYTDTISIAQVRELITTASRQPISSPYQLHLIEAELLTREAQQAMLKILEEPPKSVLIYISTPNLDLLLPTIISRLKLVNLNIPLSVSSQLNKENASFWTNILNQTPWQRLLVTESLAKDRLTVLAWLNTQLLYLQSVLETDFSKNKTSFALNPAQLAFILRQLLDTKKYLASNVSIKLAIDHLFLNLPVINEAKND